MLISLHTPCIHRNPQDYAPRKMASVGSHISGEFCNTHLESCTYADKAYIAARIVELIDETIAVVALGIFHFV